jgi:hypothetical protein
MKAFTKLYEKILYSRNKCILTSIFLMVGILNLIG